MRGGEFSWREPTSGVLDAVMSSLHIVCQHLEEMSTLEHHPDKIRQFWGSRPPIPTTTYSPRSKIVARCPQHGEAYVHQGVWPDMLMSRERWC